MEKEAVINTIEINKPTLIAVGENLRTYKKDSDIGETINALEQGEQVLIQKVYHDGMSLLQNIHKYLQLKLPNTTLQEQHDYRAEYHRLSNGILLEVVNHKLKVKKSPVIGWLSRFYPENNNFFLTFPQIQGLNSSWQWYTNGIDMPVLRNKIHPFYGTYFPTRFEHLILFDNWLKRYEGPKKSAIEVGVGCGVMSLQLVKHSFQKVYGTDINPNAIVGFKELMGETKLSRKIELDLGSLFGKWEKQTELIVFNPPWLPKNQKFGSIDDAIYYDKDLFSSFFKEAKKRLLPEGKLVIIFSNMAQITNLTTEHPIEKELADENRFELIKKLNRAVSVGSKKTKRDQNWRKDESVELWELKHK